MISNSNKRFVEEISREENDTDDCSEEFADAEGDFEHNDERIHNGDLANADVELPALQRESEEPFELTPVRTISFAQAKKMFHPFIRHFQPLPLIARRTETRSTFPLTMGYLRDNSEWTNARALRELVANMTDEVRARINGRVLEIFRAEGTRRWTIYFTADVEGTKIVFAEIRYDAEDQSLELVNHSVALTPDVLLMGFSKKRNIPGIVGKFGEGLKLAILVLTRNQHSVSIRTSGQVWKFERNGPNMIQHVIKKCRRYAKSAEWPLIVRVEDVSVTDDDFATMLSLVPPLHYVSTKFGEILLDDRFAQCVYVSGFFVASGDTMGAYNLRNVPLTRDRNVLDRRLLQFRVANIYNDILVGDCREGVAGDRARALDVFWQMIARTIEGVPDDIYAFSEEGIGGTGPDIANRFVVDPRALIAVREWFARTYSGRFPIGNTVLVNPELLAHPAIANNDRIMRVSPILYRMLTDYASNEQRSRTVNEEIQYHNRLLTDGAYFVAIEGRLFSETLHDRLHRVFGLRRDQFHVSDSPHSFSEVFISGDNDTKHVRDVYVHSTVFRAKPGESPMDQIFRLCFNVIYPCLRSFLGGSEFLVEIIRRLADDPEQSVRLERERNNGDVGTDEVESTFSDPDYLIAEGPSDNDCDDVDESDGRDFDKTILPCAAPSAALLQSNPIVCRETGEHNAYALSAKPTVMPPVSLTAPSIVDKGSQDNTRTATVPQPESLRITAGMPPAITHDKCNRLVPFSSYGLHASWIREHWTLTRRELSDVFVSCDLPPDADMQIRETNDGRTIVIVADRMMHASIDRSSVFELIWQLMQQQPH